MFRCVVLRHDLILFVCKVTINSLEPELGRCNGAKLQTFISEGAIKTPKNMPVPALK